MKITMKTRQWSSPKKCMCISGQSVKFGGLDSQGEKGLSKSHLVQPIGCLNLLPEVLPKGLPDPGTSP